MTSDGARIWKIHEVPDVVSRESPGVLHPHFSHDGKRLLWAERLGSGGGAFGRWVLKLADFSFQRGTPRLSNIRNLPPEPGRAFYESHGFSPDDSRVIFSSTRDGNLEIYTLRLEDHAVERLTNDPAWDEHSHFSPDGKWIVWMSSRGLRFQARPRFELETEFWLMRADGSCPRRLTSMHDPSSPHFREEGFVVAADVAWAEDGQSLFALFITGRPETNRRGSGFIARLALPPGWDAE
jgi:Tol biopolymer transport system component